MDIEWAREQIKTYGRDDHWVMAYILGQFPPTSINALIGPEEVEASMNRYVAPDKYNFSQKRLGIDAARFGDDSWVITPRQGLVAFKPVEMRNPRSNEVAARVARGKEKWGSELEFFDGTGGYGSGAIDALIQSGHDPIEVQFGGKAIDPRYFNKRSEMWFEMIKWIRRGGKVTKNRIYIKELSTPTYTFQNGKFRLEEKEQIKKRLGFSPNYGDSLALTFAQPEAPANLISELQAITGNRNHKSDYDPLDEKRMEMALG